MFESNISIHFAYGKIAAFLSFVLFTIVSYTTIFHCTILTHVASFAVYKIRFFILFLNIFYFFLIYWKIQMGNIYRHLNVWPATVGALNLKKNIFFKETDICICLHDKSFPVSWVHFLLADTFLISRMFCWLFYV